MGKANLSLPLAFDGGAQHPVALPHGTGRQPAPHQALLAPLLPGETEGEGGLQKSSNSDTLSQTLPSQLGADSEVPSAASVRWDSGEKRRWDGSGSGRTVRHSPAPSGILLSVGKGRRGAAQCGANLLRPPFPALSPSASRRVLWEAPRQVPQSETPLRGSVPAGSGMPPREPLPAQIWASTVSSRRP